MFAFEFSNPAKMLKNLVNTILKAYILLIFFSKTRYICENSKPKSNPFMKAKFILFLLFIIFCPFSDTFAQANPFSNDGFEVALQRSKSEKKQILLFLYADWCSHCNKMKKEVFTNAEVANFITANFVAIAIDAEKGEGIRLKKKYGVNAFPSFFFLNQNGETLYGFTKELAAEAFISEAKIALIPERQLPYLEQKFNNDFSNVDKCYAYITTLKKINIDVSVPTKKYLQTQTDKQLISEANWRIIANGVSDIDSREFQYVLKNQAAFAKVSSSGRVERKLVNIVSELLRPFVNNLDTVNYYKNRPLAKTVGIRKTDSLIFTYDLMLSEHTKNWKMYAKVATESLPSYYWNDPEKLKETALVYQKNITKTESLKQALSWTERSVALKPSADGYLLAARLSKKMNALPKSREFAEKSKDFSTSLGFSSKEADDFLSEIKTN